MAYNLNEIQNQSKHIKMAVGEGALASRQDDWRTSAILHHHIGYTVEAQIANINQINQQTGVSS